MEIVGIYPPYLYSIKKSDNDLSEYSEIFNRLTSEEYVTDFFDKFADAVSDFWINYLGNVRDEIEDYITEIDNDIWDIRDEIKSICNSEERINKGDLQSLFIPHSKYDIRELPHGGGRSIKYGIGYLPVKCYGISRPSLIRIYAIELSINCYIIIYGGIKIDLDTNKCPALDSQGRPTTLENEIRNTVMNVCHFLKANGIYDPESMADYMRKE